MDLMPILRKPHSCWFGTRVLEHVVVSLTWRQACQCSLTLSSPFMEGIANTEEGTHVIELRHRCGDAHGISVFFYLLVKKSNQSLPFYSTSKSCLTGRTSRPAGKFRDGVQGSTLLGGRKISGCFFHACLG